MKFNIDSKELRLALEHAVANGGQIVFHVERYEMNCEYSVSKEWDSEKTNITSLN